MEYNSSFWPPAEMMIIMVVMTGRQIIIIIMTGRKIIIIICRPLSSLLSPLYSLLSPLSSPLSLLSLSLSSPLLSLLSLLSPLSPLSPLYFANNFEIIIGNICCKPFLNYNWKLFCKQFIEYGLAHLWSTIRPFGRPQR